MNNQEIIEICQALEREGKSPSVALVKARMTGPKILPAIISGIKQYQANPSYKTEKPSEGNDRKDDLAQTSSEESTQQQLEQRVKALEEQVASLTQLVQALSKK